MKFILNFLIVFTCFNLCNSQVDLDSINSNFQDHLRIPEENIYLHVNKSIYTINEDIGFTAYVLETKSQLPSINTRNIYCQLIDRKNKIIKEELLLVKQGVANYKFTIDSLVPPGDYTLKAFTNWMRNFEEPQYSMVPIKVLDLSGNLPNTFLNNVKSNKYDLQLLPEGGHAVDEVFIKVGVILKDKYGLGIRSTGKVLRDDLEVGEVVIDDNGIGSFLWLPSKGKRHSVAFQIGDERIERPLPLIEETGIVLSAKEYKKNLLIEISTNTEYLKSKRPNEFTITINGNNKLKVYRIKLNKLNNFLSLDLKDLQPGVNQINLFDSKGETLSERLFFNYVDLKIADSSDERVQLEMDSLKIKLKFRDDLKGLLSVSILPKETISAPKHRHIVSKFKLAPYVKGVIEDPSQYFENTDLETRYAMDNLLLTQGWKMFSWQEILNGDRDYKYSFESGLTVTANINNNDDKKFFMPSSLNNSGEIIDIEKEQKFFILKDYFPASDDKFMISALDEKGRAKKTGMVPKFEPRFIPRFNKSRRTLPIFLEKEIPQIAFEPLMKVDDKLDTIVIQTTLNEKRNKRLSNRSRGRIDFFDDNDRRTNFNILQYLRRNGFNASRDRNGNVEITLQSLRFDPENADAIVIIDDIPFEELNILLNFQMSIVDYIEIDNSGFRRVLGRIAPLIIIKTDPSLFPDSKSSKIFNEYSIPLKFASPVTFYKPNYYSYTSKLYNKLGVIDWKAEVDLKDGESTFTTPYLGKSEFIMIVEGMTEDGTLIHETKVVEISK